jgi:glycerol uptake facilitator-like aquaporin
VFNFLTEVMCTAALVFGALMMYARRELLDPSGRALFRSVEGEARGGAAGLPGLPGSSGIHGRRTAAAS